MQVGESVVFAGYNISREGVQPIAERIAAIRDFPTPPNTKKLKGFHKDQCNSKDFSINSKETRGHPQDFMELYIYVKLHIYGQSEGRERLIGA